MSQENVEIVRRWMNAWNDGDLEATLSYMDPSIEVEIAMGSPNDGVYHGHDGLIKSMTEFWSSFATYESELGECISAGDDVVFAVTHRGVGRGSGVPVEASHWQVATLQGGKMVRWHNFMGREEALEAAGLSE